VIIARAIPAAINAYSIAVAPDSSAKNFWIMGVALSFLNGAKTLIAILLTVS
jgi:hypothetical protein